MLRSTPHLRTAVAGAALLALTGCDVSQLQFRADTRLSFRQPLERASVTLPVTVAWTMQGFTASGLDGSDDPRRGAYVVFVDRPPLPVGKDLRWLARDEPECGEGCPSTEYLNQNDVYVTRTPALTLTRLPRSGGVGEQEHFVNVVLVDGSGRRTSESSWFRTFTTPREASS